MQPIGTTTSAAGITTDGTATTAVTQKELGQDDFLKLLAAQLGAQDPMAPTDNTQFISQMANFSSLQQMSALNTNFTSFANGQKADAAPSYLGKQVSVTDAAGNAVTGIATGYHVNSGAVSLTINDQDYSIDTVTGVSLPTP